MSLAVKDRAVAGKPDNKISGIRDLALRTLRRGKSFMGALFHGYSKKSQKTAWSSTKVPAATRKAALDPTMKTRVIHLHVAAIDEEAPLELVEMKLAGKPITFGQPFEAADNWLQELTIKLRNVSDKPITFLDFGGGLIKGADQEPKMGESYHEGISWNFGQPPNKKHLTEKRNPVTLYPGLTIELTYANVDSAYQARDPISGQYCKLILGPISIEFADGTLDWNGKVLPVPVAHPYPENGSSIGLDVERNPKQLAAMTYENHNQVEYDPLSIRVPSGTAVDKDSVAIPDVHLGLFTEQEHRLVATAITDENGRFEFQGVPAGRYRLVVKYSGFCTANTLLQVKGGKPERSKNLVIHMELPRPDRCSYGSYK